ncbi:MAG: cytochrome P450 [Planctomycetota bacterium]
MAAIKFPGPAGRVWTTVKFMRDPFSSYREWKRKYGNTFLIKALNGNVIATCDPNNIERIFSLPTEHLTQFATKTIRPLIGESSLFVIDGNRHKQQRKILTSCFRKGYDRSQAQLMEQICINAAKNWTEKSEVKMMDSALDVSLEVIVRLVFGFQDPQEIENVQLAVKQYVDSFHPSLAFSRIFHRPLLGLSPWVRFRNSRFQLHQLLDEEMARRKRSEDFGTDLLSQLLLSEDDHGCPVNQSQIRDHMVAMLLAGHETTQIAIAWAMSWLHRHPNCLQRLRDELGDHDVQKCVRNEYLVGVCNEALRLNSVVSDTVRQLKVPLELVEGVVPAGSNLAVSICLVHEDPELYPNPFEFQPERWSSIRPGPNEFLPFGGGIRRCPGASLAMLELRTVVATWIRNFDFRLPDDAPEKESVYRRNITMAPVSGIPLILEGRLG